MQNKLLIAAAVVIVVLASYYVLSGGSVEEAYSDPNDTIANLITNLQDERYYTLVDEPVAADAQKITTATGDPQYAAVGRELQFDADALANARTDDFLNSLKSFFKELNIKLPKLRMTTERGASVILVDGRPCLIADPSDSQMKHPEEAAVHRSLALANTILKQHGSTERLYLRESTPPGLVRMSQAMYRIIQNSATVPEEFKLRYIE